MFVDAIFQSNRLAMSFERARIEAAAMNIAESNTALGPDQAARRHAVAQPAFAALLPSGDAMPTIETEAAAVRTVLDPDHPLADADGNVRYPDVDLAQQMTTLMSASRAYEANVRALNTLRSMVMKSLEIGRS